MCTIKYILPTFSDNRVLSQQSDNKGYFHSGEMCSIHALQVLFHASYDRGGVIAVWTINNNHLKLINYVTVRKFTTKRDTSIYYIILIFEQFYSS